VSCDTYILLRAFADELVRCGLTDACTSPGSRSTPLVVTFARDRRLRCWSHIDERAAGFFALGATRATGRPAALICTSGTAAANYLPAVVEAAQARLPLLVLTADRPPELRDVGAGQTIDQLKLFGSSTKSFVEVGTHAATPERVSWIRQLACRAYWTALDGRPGPVHLNFPLREPLVLDEALPETEPGGDASREGRPWISRTASGGGVAQAAEQAAPIVEGAQRGIVVAGGHELGVRRRLGAAIAAFAARTGWPVLADPLSGARSGVHAIAHWDLLLRSPQFAACSDPDVVLRIGDLPTSKHLRRWLAASGATQLSVDPHAAWQDPAAAVHWSLTAEPVDLLPALSRSERPAGDGAWLAHWRDADARAALAVETQLGDALSEPAVVAELARSLPREATLMVAASMPIRHAEAFFPVLDAPPQVLANRGANGIDGTVSTAFGVAAASADPVVLLIGDVALAHDLGGLLASTRLGLRLTVVLLDNSGGGIFDFLPVSSQRDVFETHIATPPGLVPERIAALFDLEYRPVTRVSEFRGALLEALPAARSTLIVVRTDRNDNVALHRQVTTAVQRELELTP
jgi:2-succinyl-5-enolpyruvyl-6-hydroxy-3-cyclohexene-1-carboxylate synthase